MKVKQTIISVAIAIIFALFIGYGIEVFDDSPEYQDYCPDVYAIQNETGCVAKGGVWTDGSDFRAPKLESVNGEVYPMSCQNNPTCYNKHEQARTKHDKVVFIASIIFGLLAIISGIILKQDSVNSGLIGGGVLLILYGTIRYWDHADEILKFILLGIVLAVLIWLGYKKLH
jgi:hypothetical protein